MIVTLFILLLSISSITCPSDRTTKPGSLERALPSIPVDVLAPREIKQSFVDQVFAEMDAIWRPAGITFAWRRIESTNAADASRLLVAIEKGRLHAVETHPSLGWIMFTDNEPEPSIHLSMSAAEELLDAVAHVDDAVLIRHDFLIERALGRALSHEVGHYLLGTKIHAPRGLMRATWPPQEIFGEARRGFELTSEQQQSAVEHLPNSLARSSSTVQPRTSCGA